MKASVAFKPATLKVKGKSTEVAYGKMFLKQVMVAYPKLSKYGDVESTKLSTGEMGNKVTYEDAPWINRAKSVVVILPISVKEDIEEYLEDNGSEDLEGISGKGFKKADRATLEAKYGLTEETLPPKDWADKKGKYAILSFNQSSYYYNKTDPSKSQENMRGVNVKRMVRKDGVVSLVDFDTSEEAEVKIGNGSICNIELGIRNTLKKFDLRSVVILKLKEYISASGSSEMDDEMNSIDDDFDFDEDTTPKKPAKPKNEMEDVAEDFEFDDEDDF